MDDVGKLVLRLAVGGLMLFHGVNKAAHGIAGITAGVQRHHLPAFVAYGVYLGELVAPLFVVAGLGTRPAAGVMAFNMLFAVWMAHLGDVLHLHPMSGAWRVELPMLYCLGALAVAFLGAGRFALSRGRGRWD